MDDYDGLSLEELQEEYDRLLDEINAGEIALVQITDELASLTAQEQLSDLPLAQQAIRWGRIGELVKDLGTSIQKIEELVEEFGVVQGYLDQGGG
jgi:hypothetical protein